MSVGTTFRKLTLKLERSMDFWKCTPCITLLRAEHLLGARHSSTPPAEQLEKIVITELRAR